MRPSSPELVAAPPVVSFADFFVGATVWVSVPIALAILRYRLYDLDLVVNRALVYGALSAIVAVFYLAAVARSNLPSR